MSYCRWSSDDYRCDLYCYASSEGYTTHVAGLRIVGDAPHLDWVSMDDITKFSEQYHAQSKWLETAEREPIGLPYDGETFHDPDLQSFLSTVTMLRDLGYNVPPDVITSIQQEMDDMESYR